MDRSGIIVSGVAVYDRIIQVPGFPQEGTLVDIGNISASSGGALCNVLLALNKLDGGIPLSAVGVIGRDEMGDALYLELQKAQNADLSGIERRDSSSYTDVYESTASHQRTFFHHRGANRLLDVSHFSFNACTKKILYIGYIMLLDALDRADKQYGTRMARLLHQAQQAGLETCVDMVSRKSDLFRDTAIPSLRYTNYCVINEVEAEEITGVYLRNKKGALMPGSMAPALRSLMDCGVSKWAIIHAPEASFGMDRNRVLYTEKGAELPAGYIRGTVGAGDTFCAGVLCAAHQGKGIRDALRAGNAAACAALRTVGATDGVVPLSEALALYDRLHE